MNEEIQVDERIGKMVDWAYSLGEEEVRRRIREKLALMKDIPKNVMHKNGAFWDDRLEPNDNDDQYRHGGDCNLCRRKAFCETQCGANEALKKITTPMLYQMYIDENPEAAAAEVAHRITPEDVLKMVGVNDGQKLLS